MSSSSGAAGTWRTLAVGAPFFLVMFVYVDLAYLLGAAIDVPAPGSIEPSWKLIAFSTLLYFVPAVALLFVHVVVVSPERLGAFETWWRALRTFFDPAAHYAIDGYVAIAGTMAVWVACGYATTAWRRRLDQSLGEPRAAR